MEKYDLLQEVKKRRMEAYEKDEYTLLNSSYAKKVFTFENDNVDGMNIIFDILVGWDEFGDPIPSEIGEYLEEFIDGDIKLGIHRSGAFSLEFPRILNCICEEGLVNLGHLSSGVVDGLPQPNKTISFPETMLEVVMMIKSGYKGSKGALLVGIPKEYFSHRDWVNEAFFDEIYDVRDNAYVKPEFVLGYLEPSDGKYSIFSREEILSNVKKH